MVSTGMAGYRDTMPKHGHVTDLREQWLVKTDGALAHHLQDREISSHLCENRCRNQQIREDFPVALSEQQVIQNEAYQRELLRFRQAEIDADIAREMAEINLRQQRRNQASLPCHDQPCSSRDDPLLHHMNIPLTEPHREKRLKPAKDPVLEDFDAEALGLSRQEVLEMKKRLEQEEKDARLARELSNEGGDADILLADMRCAVEAQDGELARLLQEREYKKLQRAKEKARQKALLKKQQRLTAQPPENEPHDNQAELLDAYCNPRDMIREQRQGHWASKSVDSDLNYVEPFEKEHIQSKANALQSKEKSQKMYNPNIRPLEPLASAKPDDGKYRDPQNRYSYDAPDNVNNPSTCGLLRQHRQPPPLPAANKKPRFPDPVSIRPASHYSSDNIVALQEESLPQPPNNDNNNSCSSGNSYRSTYPTDYGISDIQNGRQFQSESAKRMSVVSDITPESGNKKKNKKAADVKKRKSGCKIQ